MEEIGYRATVFSLEGIVGNQRSYWKNPQDAITWAKSELPHLSEDQLLIEFNNLKPVNGKKAPVWFERVLELKINGELSELKQDLIWKIPNI